MVSTKSRITRPENYRATFARLIKSFLTSGDANAIIFANDRSSSTARSFCICTLKITQYS